MRRCDGIRRYLFIFVVSSANDNDLGLGLIFQQNILDRLSYLIFPGVKKKLLSFTLMDFNTIVQLQGAK